MHDHTESAPEVAAPFRGWGARLGFVLFFMMLFVPTTYTPIKAVLLALVLTALLLQGLLRGQLPLHRSIVFGTMVFVALGLAFMLRGLANGAPGALRVGTVYALWPLVYTLILAGMAGKNVLPGLLRVIVIATVAIGVYGFSYTLYAAGVLPRTLYVPLDQGQRIGFYEGFVEFNLYSLSSLLFAVPFVVGALLFWPKEGAPASRRLLWTALVVGLGLVALSARRALLLALSASPVVALALRQALPWPERRATRTLVLRLLAGGALILVGLSLALHVVYGLSFAAIAEMFGRGFAFESYVRASERKEQLLDLMASWIQTPLLGAGHGAAAGGSPRDADMPWSYELSYVALLFHTGVLGFLAYAGGVVWILRSGVRIVGEGGTLGRYLAPVLVGMVSFLIGNAADPYLEKFDYMWVIFLPLGFINVWLLTGPPSALEPLARPSDSPP